MEHRNYLLLKKFLTYELTSKDILNLDSGEVRFLKSSGNYRLKNGVLANQNLYVVPEAYTELCITMCHSFMGNKASHMNFKKTLEVAQRIFFWKGMRRAVKKFIDHCQICDNQPLPLHESSGDSIFEGSSKLPNSTMSWNDLVHYNPRAQRECLPICGAMQSHQICCQNDILEQSFSMFMNCPTNNSGLDDTFSSQETTSTGLANQTLAGSILEKQVMLLEQCHREQQSDIFFAWSYTYNKIKDMKRKIHDHMAKFEQTQTYFMSSCTTTVEVLGDIMKSISKEPPILKEKIQLPPGVLDECILFIKYWEKLLINRVNLFLAKATILKREIWKALTVVVYDVIMLEDAAGDMQESKVNLFEAERNYYNEKIEFMKQNMLMTMKSILLRLPGHVQYLMYHYTQCSKEDEIEDDSDMENVLFFHDKRNPALSRTERMLASLLDDVIDLVLQFDIELKTLLPTSSIPSPSQFVDFKAEADMVIHQTFWDAVIQHMKIEEIQNDLQSLTSAADYKAEAVYITWLGPFEPSQGRNRFILIAIHMDSLGTETMMCPSKNITMTTWFCENITRRWPSSMVDFCIDRSNEDHSTLIEESALSLGHECRDISNDSKILSLLENNIARIFGACVQFYIYEQFTDWDLKASQVFDYYNRQVKEVKNLNATRKSLDEELM